MVGKRYYNWTILKEIFNDKPGKWYECLCDCGNIRIKKGTELRAGRGKECRDCQYKKLYDKDREIGKRYGRWTVLRYHDIHRNLQRYEVQCDCGLKKLYVVAELRARKSSQCTTCHNKENAINNKTHGMHNTETYAIWCAMIQRCNNINSSNYRWYGKRGIKVCDRWLKFENFLEDMGERPENLTLDRIDNDGDYKPENCRWISHKENYNNRSNNKTKKATTVT